MSDEPYKRKFVIRDADRNEWLSQLPLREYFVDRGDTQEAKAALEAVLGRDVDERTMQEVFQRHPLLLADRLSAGMGWVIPQKRLGSEFVTDFVIAEQLSPGFYWQAVELESPRVPMFTKSGNPSRQLVHAIRQIQEWRSWLESNITYARNPRSANGLGLIDISSRLPGLIVIGRRRNTSDATNELRRQMMTDLRVEIRSYDAFMERAERLPLYYKFHDPSWGNT